jgi:hypothetical protein
MNDAVSQNLCFLTRSVALVFYAASSPVFYLSKILSQKLSDSVLNV